MLDEFRLYDSELTADEIFVLSRPPWHIEAEGYSANNGVQEGDAEDAGAGGYIGWKDNESWAEYTINVESAGLHKLELRVASNGGDGSINIVSDGEYLRSVHVGDTGGWQTWETKTVYVDFATTGTNTLRLEFDVPSKGLNLNWLTYVAISAPVAIKVGSEPEQMMRYGLDFERLWYWEGSGLGPVPDWCVNDCNIDYIRCAVNAGYELNEASAPGDENSYKLNAYTSRIIPMMAAMQNANPNIKWFASPRPLAEAVSSASWQPYPIWITGATTYTSGNYDFDPIKCAQYLIRYLRLMKDYGFKISYLDLTNEWQANDGSSSGRITQADARDIVEYMKAYIENPPEPGSDPTDPTGFYASNYPVLESGDMPSTVAASSWEFAQGVSWIQNLDTERRRDAIDIASSHNTNRDDGSGSEQGFADQARATLGADTEVWQTELHGWKNKHGADEVNSFDHFMRAVRGGFSGINGWLALGGSSQGHTYLWHTSSEVTRGVKYFIFKKLSNTSNYGYYLDADEPVEFSNTMALIRDNLLTVWINNASTSAQFVEIDLSGHVLDGDIRYTKWNEDLDWKGVEGKPIYSTGRVP